MKKIMLSIGGMTCSGCSSGLEKYLNKQNGIKNETVNLVLSVATIEYEGISIKNIERFVRNVGFESLGEFRGIDDGETKPLDKLKLVIFGILIIFMIYIYIYISPKDFIYQIFHILIEIIRKFFLPFFL